MSRTILTNARIITPTKDFVGSVIIEDDRISEILEGTILEEGIDLNGDILAPGLVDIHSDYLEKELRPRPSAKFPMDIAFYFMDQRAAACGITNVHSAISFTHSPEKGREFSNAIEQALEIDELRKNSIVKHNVHARLTPNSKAVLSYLNNIREIESLKLVVFNDEIPGARQYDFDRHVEMRMKAYPDKTREEVRVMLEEKVKELSEINLRPEIQVALGDVFVLGSHDDTTVEHVQEAKTFGCELSEMPTTIEAAREAKEQGLFVCMGAPNYVRGGSHCGNLGCNDAMKENLVDMICSDYHFPSLLISVIKMIDDNINISEAFNMVTLNPAKLIGEDHEIGSIEIGKKADLITIDTSANFAKVKNVWVDGVLKFSTSAKGIGSLRYSFESKEKEPLLNN